MLNPQNDATIVQQQRVATIHIFRQGLVGKTYAILEGRANIGGTAIGALILAVISTSFNMLLLPFSYALLIQAAIILLAVTIQRPPRL